jgi:hypothetical protein
MRHSADSSSRRQRLAALGRWLRARLRPVADNLLTSSLHALLIAVYALTVYALVLAAGNFPDLRVTPPLHLILIALFLFALGGVPLSRWIRRRLDSLIASWPDDPYGAINQLQAELSRDPSLGAIVPTVVATITATLKLPYGAITSPPDGNTVSVGLAPANAERLTLPLRFGDAVDTFLAIVETAGLTEELTNGGPYLVLAPIDLAFATLAAPQREALLSDPKVVGDFVRNHVIEAYVPRGSLAKTPVWAVAETRDRAVWAAGDTGKTLGYCV